MVEGATDSAAQEGALQTRGTAERVISFLAYFYGVTGVLLSAALLLKVILLAGSNSVSLGREEGRFFVGLLSLGPIGSIYYGLTRKKSWAPDLILYLHGTGLLSNFHRSESLSSLFLKPIGIAFSLFQIWFFTRPQIKALFNEGQITLF